MDLPTTHTKWTSCTGGSWIIITKYLKRHANAKRLQENIGWVGLIFLSGILSGGSLETMHLGHWDWHEMKQCKNPCSENESKQLPSMLLVVQAHPIPSQSWWASHSCTGGIDPGTSECSRHQTNIHVGKCGNRKGNAWSTNDPPVLFVDTPTQELVVKIFTQKKWNELLHKSKMWSLGWIWNLTPTQELDEKVIMDSHAASYTGVLDSFFAAAITAHLMLEDWSFEPFNLYQTNHLWLPLHLLLLQWYHQRSHSQQVPLAQVPLAQALS